MECLKKKTGRLKDKGKEEATFEAEREERWRNRKRQEKPSRNLASQSEKFDQQSPIGKSGIEKKIREKLAKFKCLCGGFLEGGYLGERFVRIKLAAFRKSWGNRFAVHLYLIPSSFPLFHLFYLLLSSLPAPSTSSLHPFEVIFAEVICYVLPPSCFVSLSPIDSKLIQRKRTFYRKVFRSLHQSFHQLVYQIYFRQCNFDPFSSRNY